jgi:hypothetical protein
MIIAILSGTAGVLVMGGTISSAIARYRMGIANEPLLLDDLRLAAVQHATTYVTATVCSDTPRHLLC